MSEPHPASVASFRVDRFAVPRPALEPFMARVRLTQRMLDERPGCRQNLVLLGAPDGETIGVVTIVEWASADAMNDARAAMQQHYAAEGFDPAAFIRALGIRADIAAYQPA
jgi:hypothetical protein